jgi:hypothetical protein
MPALDRGRHRRRALRPPVTRARPLTAAARRCETRGVTGRGAASLLLLACGALAACAGAPPAGGPGSLPGACAAACEARRARCADACLAESGPDREACAIACETAHEVCAADCG